ncbi:M1 family metallopeptidase [Pedobacter psychroterrae]|uniref:M1 family metallopeptidase n=1 Tax=Pedobacter psychroterrae TaxID=2530453 RepID=UPI0013F14426|nr:M1 family metallopeptidase [Pedobacter psychroterrae]
MKGSITIGREWWDLKHYAIDIHPDFIKKSLTGRNKIAFKVLQENRNAMMQIDLQSPLVIDSAIFGGQKVSIERVGEAWFLKLPNLKMKAELAVDIYYSGTPKESFNPPWDSGISWTTDSLGRPWITMGVQGLGASVWLPCKEHQSDEPEEGMSISITIPDSLTAVANGRLQRVTTNIKGTSTYEWAVHSPINNYGIAFYVGKYTEVNDVYKGEKGSLDTDYWVLDYNKHKVQSYLKIEAIKTLEAFEHWFGPYPFYKDSFKMVETPYPGMEHQSAIAYGNGFKYGRVKANNLSYWDLKTDRLIVHEIAHEWFGNSVTTNDITEQWIHEGFAGYAEELFIEYQYGKKAANEFFEARTVGKTKNVEPLIRRYGIFETGGSYVYLRGWKLVHMLRTIVDNDEKFRKILRKICNRFYHESISSAQLESLFTKLSGRDLRLVFNQYLRTSNVPVLEYQLVGDTLRFRYTNCIPKFTMPIKTNLTGKQWLFPTTSWTELKLNTFNNSTLHLAADFYVEVKNSN